MIPAPPSTAMTFGVTLAWEMTRLETYIKAWNRSRHVQRMNDRRSQSDHYAHCPASDPSHAHPSPLFLSLSLSLYRLQYIEYANKLSRLTHTIQSDDLWRRRNISFLCMSPRCECTVSKLISEPASVDVAVQFSVQLVRPPDIGISEGKAMIKAAELFLPSF